MKISMRLLLLFLLVAVLPLALFSFFNLQQGEATLRTEVLARMAGLADKKALHVKSYLAERLQDVRMLARGPSVMEAIGILPQAYASGRRDAGEYARADSRMRRYFDRYVEDEGVFYDVFLITPQGEVVYTQKHEADFATNLLTGPYRDTQLADAFRAVRMTLEPVVSGYEHYAPSQVPALFIAAPIMVNGKFRGVFAVQLGNELFYRVATDATGLGLSGEAAFAQRDGDGFLMTMPLKYRPDAALKIRFDRQESRQLPMLRALSGEAGAGVTLDYRGKQQLSAWRYLPELDWGMVVKIDADEVFASIYRQRIVVLEMVLGLLLFTGLLAYYFGRQISAPLNELARTADEVAQGALGKRVDESAPGELGLFARAFNRMTEKLQSVYGTLEQRVEQRTQELNVANDRLQEEIYERKQKEQELRVAAIAFETHEAIMITGPDDRIMRVNKAFERITGYRADEVVGHTPHQLSSGKHDQAFYEAMWQQITATGQWEGEIWDKRKNGDIYPKWLTVTTVRDAGGRVSHYVGVFSDISQRKLAEEEIYSLAYYDTLTKLPNRRLLQDRFGLALAASERSASYGAVLFLDLDKFKMLNDTLGHGYGDLLLIEVAARIKACVREMDTVARMGGDEFVVLIEELSADAEEASQKAAHIAEKIRSSLAQPYSLEGQEQRSSPSIGVCLYRGRAESVESLLKHADLAMYQAKESGRNTVCFFDPVMQQAVEGRAALEADLRRAVALQQLHVYYQIQLDNEHRPLGAEALLRWIHPTRGMVSPAQFIPLAEETLLILEIGHWVLESACRQLKLWEQHEQTRDLTIAVNVSAQQFALPDFVGQVAAVLHKHRVDPSRLKLELTESVVLEDVQGTVGIMHALKGLGIRLSMDDFGTGYSSLSYLKLLPLDQLKIDQSFVRDITTDPNDAVLVQTIIDMARNFRLNVIAEGVETEAQLAFLKLHGCMAYQGYLFSKPVPIEEFEALLGK